VRGDDKQYAVDEGRERGTHSKANRNERVNKREKYAGKERQTGKRCRRASSKKTSKVSKIQIFYVKTYENGCVAFRT
jgi:hypothetical protein